MKLLIDNSRGAFSVSVPCLHCGRMEQLAQTIIDKDGPAFQAYYHRACAEEVFGKDAVTRAEVIR